jgi:hypothetical protein
MRRNKSFAVLMAMMLGCSAASRADFKYTESSKMTGGALMGAMRFMGAFSKQARESNAAQISTRAVKGNRFREEHPDGRVEVIDLDGRRFINIDPKAKTYSVMTFEEMKQRMLAAQQRMKDEQAKQAPQQPGQPKTNVKITPKIESSETGATRNILGLDTKETKIRIEMLMETDDPKTQGQQISTVVNTDSWIAPTVPGYDEIKKFYMKMAKEMDWVPGAVMSSMANSNVQIGMTELKKNNAKINGIPMLQTISMSLGGNAMAAAEANGQQAQTSTPPPPPPAQTQEPTSAKDAIAQGIAGHFGLGGFGKKKKKDDTPAATDNSQTASSQTTSGSGTAPSNAPAAAGTPGSLMDMTVEVTSYSSDALDKSLFDIPAGYTLVQPPDPDAKPGRR